MRKYVGRLVFVAILSLSGLMLSKHYLYVSVSERSLNRDGARSAIVQKSKNATNHSLTPKTKEVHYTRASEVEPITIAMSEFEIPRQRLPNIIIIGCMKCGTTAFQMFLGYHSRINVGDFKERDYFCREDKYLKGVNYYKSLMPATKKGVLTIDKSPSYLHHEDTPRRIAEAYANETLRPPKIVLVVCDPVKRAYSEYIHRKLRNYYYEENYENYTKWASKKIEQLAPPSGDMDAYYGRLDEARRKNPKIANLLEGVYSYHLRRWMKYLPHESFVFVDGEKLLTEPGEVMLRAQKDLGLRVEIEPRHFAYNAEKGFFCVNLGLRKSRCLPSYKGRTRKVVNDTYVQLEVTRETKRTLEELYRPFNEHLRLLTHTDFAF